MGAGQAEHAVEAGHQRQRPGNLGFFAAHDIGGLGLLQARHQTDGKTGIACGNGNQLVCIQRRAGHAAIGRFLPALPAADHATGDDRRGATRVQPGIDQPQQRRFIAVAGQRTHPVGRGGFGADSPRTHCIGAQMRGAPVNRDPVGLGHPVTTTPPSITKD